MLDGWESGIRKREGGEDGWMRERGGDRAGWTQEWDEGERRGQGWMDGAV